MKVVTLSEYVQVGLQTVLPLYINNFPLQ